MNFYQASQLTTSTKITFATIDCVERVKIFSADGANWKRTVKHFVVGVKEDGTSISSWQFDPLTNTLTIIGGANPKGRNISLTYRKFFANSPQIKPYDLASGVVVDWLPLINTIGSIGQQLDDENTGIVLESSSSVSLLNRDGYFDEIFDTLIWENQSLRIYSWIEGIAISEAVQLFEGVIETKSFTESLVTFKVKDFVYKLKNFVDLGSFSESDGSILPSLIGTSKRRIYGQADYVACASLSATLDGYNLTGNLTGTIGAKAITGTATLFLSELSPGDEVICTINGTEYKYAIDAISTDTTFNLSKELEVNFANQAVKVLPKVPYRQKNRTWQIANHKLRAPSATITNVISGNVFEVNTSLDFFTGDAVLVNGIATTIRRISDSYIITESTVTPLPVIGNTIDKRPVQRVFFGSKELYINRDFTVTNSTYANLVFSDLAEFNIAPEKGVGVNLTFTNGSRVVTTTAVIDLKTILKPRDWIRADNISEATWYEVLEVLEQQVTFRTAFTGATATKAARYKSVDYIDENSLITVCCLGMEHTGLWMKTASDCVRHLILNDAGFSQVNETKFAKAKADCPYILSMVIPENLGESAPMIRDVITKINESVLGSLYGDSSQNISYSILNSTKPEITSVIDDTDILSFSVQTNQKIINAIKINYRPFVDIYSGEATFETLTQNSKFVNDLIGIKNTSERTLYLYETDKVLIMAQRLLLFNSLSVSSVTIKGKMNLSQIVVSDKVYIGLDRLFKRFGGDAKVKLGTVTAVKRDGYNSEITLTDLGNIFNRVMAIAPNATPVYSLASDAQKMKYGFILSSTTETLDESSDVGLGTNIIG